MSSSRFSSAFKSRVPLLSPPERACAPDFPSILRPGAPYTAREVPAPPFAAACRAGGGALPPSCNLPPRTPGARRARGRFPCRAAPPAPGPCRRQKRGRGPSPFPERPGDAGSLPKSAKRRRFSRRARPRKKRIAPGSLPQAKKGKGTQPFPERPGDTGSLPKTQALFPGRVSPKRADRARFPLAAAADFEVGAQPAASSRRAPQRPSCGRTPASAASSATCQRK